MKFVPRANAMKTRAEFSLCGRKKSEQIASGVHRLSTHSGDPRRIRSAGTTSDRKSPVHGNKLIKPRRVPKFLKASREPWSFPARVKHKFPPASREQPPGRGGRKGGLRENGDARRQEKWKRAFVHNTQRRRKTFAEVIISNTVALAERARVTSDYPLPSFVHTRAQTHNTHTHTCTCARAYTGERTLSASSYN